MRPMMHIQLIMTLAWVLLLSGCRDAPTDLTWQRIQDLGTLRIGMEANWVPFEYIDGTGQLVGLDVDLAHELGQRLGLDVNLVANLSFDGLYDALTAGRVDAVISAVVVDMARSADFGFSTPYFDAGQVLVAGPGSNINSPQSLAGRILAVELGSESDSIARRWVRRVTDLTLLHTDSTDAALTSVAQNQADAAITDRAAALIGLKILNHRGTKAQRLDGANLHIRGEPVTEEQYAIVVQRNSQLLLDAINDILADMRNDGTLDSLERKWLGP